MKARLFADGILKRIDELSPWAFTCSLYLARWVIVVPVGLGQFGTTKSVATFNGSAIMLLFNFVLLAPLLETLLECVVPYWVLSKAGVGSRLDSGMPI